MSAFRITFSAIAFAPRLPSQYHLKAFKKGPTGICPVFGQTCEGLHTISQWEEPPDLETGDLVRAGNIGARGSVSATWSNGFPPAKVVHASA